MGRAARFKTCVSPLHTPATSFHNRLTTPLFYFPLMPPHYHTVDDYLPRMIPARSDRDRFIVVVSSIRYCEVELYPDNLHDVTAMLKSITPRIFAGIKPCTTMTSIELGHLRHCDYDCDYSVDSMPYISSLLTLILLKD